MHNILITPTVSWDRRKGFIFSIEENWINYANSLKFNLIIYNYDINFFKKNKKIDGVIFSGGNDIYSKKKKKNNFLRDKFETIVLKKALKIKIPILGVCRGFQFINFFFKGKQKKIKHHTRVDHEIIINNSFFKKNTKINVNSFHKFAIMKVHNQLKASGIHKIDNSIEIAESKKLKVLCMMFHPERKNKSQEAIDNFLKFFFKIK
jgi:putative glutamine amidotransferase